MKRTSRIGSIALLGVFAPVGLLAAAATVHAQDWPRWRGPDATGMARGDAPTRWSDTENLKWKVDIPGRGHSSPVLWGDRIFLTTAIPTGPPEAERPYANHRFVVLALDTHTGEVVWERTATEAVPHEGHHSGLGSFASPSPVTDGEHVFAFFGSRGIFCYDLDGQLVWQKHFGQMRKLGQFGEGTAPVLHADRLILKFDHEGPSFIVALDKRTGEEIWRAERDEISSWSEPLVVEHQGRTQVVVAATQKVRSYDFGTGELIWETTGLGDHQIPTPVSRDGVVYVMSGYVAPNLMAIRLGREGDLTGSDAIVWSKRRGNSYVSSPLLHENQLYVVTDSGILRNCDATTGESNYLARLPRPSYFTASPVGANGKLYLANGQGQVIVVRLGKTYEVLATNRLEDASFVATPAIVDGEIFLRSRSSLYCISEGN